MSETIIDGGRSYEIEDTIIDVDGEQFATGLWIPHEPDAIDHPLMSSDVASAIRDWSDVKEVIANPNRTPAEKRFPNDVWIRSQGQVGSCAGYAGAWSLARTRVDAGQPYVPLSGESLYSQVNGGRDRGSALERNIRAMVTTGVAPEGLNTPGRFYTESSLPAAAKAERHRFRAHEWYQVRTELELAIAIAAGFIVGVACHVGRNWRNYQQDVLVGDSGVGNHAVIVDDLRFNALGRPQFRMVNSHGKSWGRGGSIWTEWSRTYASTVRNHVFYAIRSSRLDPKGPRPPQVIA
jgi:hypothetical protein